MRRMKERGTMTPRRAVYTALLGDYEDISEQPIARETDVPFICLTDRDDLLSDTWTFVLAELPFPFDLVRSQRDFKIRGHRVLDEYDETLYIDNSVQLHETPDVILDEWLADADFAVSEHSFRERVIDEFDEIVRLNYDDAGRVNEQLLHYAEAYPDVLHERPYWNGMLARRSTAAVAETMRIWFDHVLRYSRRDQLSANVAFSLGPAGVHSIAENNNRSSWHRWPVDVRRRVEQSVLTGRRTGPLLAEVARLEREVLLQKSRSDELVGEVEVADRRRQAAERETARAIAEKACIEQRLAETLGTLSRRASRPIRAVRESLRKRTSGGPTD